MLVWLFVARPWLEGWERVKAVALADRAPLAGWTDRRAAREAARAATRLGFVHVVAATAGGAEPRRGRVGP